MIQTCNVNITYFFIFSSDNFKKLITKTEKKKSKMATENEYVNNLFQEIYLIFLTLRS